MKYNKLVRDKIPEIILKDSKNPIIHIANKKEYWEQLNKKLLEEVNEFIKNPIKEEFADILEVMHAISDFKKFNKREIIKIKEDKAKLNGKFKNRIILEQVK
jgi:predicted house-cleaning noncanonical NTP pyrophosphatase (MazG superfamily)